MPYIRKPLILGLFGTSLTEGRLNADWPAGYRFIAAARALPSCVGPLKVVNQGKGSQNSDWGAANAHFLAEERCTHILTEGFAINDSVVVAGVPAVSRPNHRVNMQTMHDLWIAANPAMQITWQTMNPVGLAGQPLRPNLGLYYGDEIDQAGIMGDSSLDNYPGWPNPLPTALTNAGDDLHPIWPGAVDTYLFPNALAWLNARMLEWWSDIPAGGGQLDFSNVDNSGLLAVV